MRLVAARGIIGTASIRTPSASKRLIQKSASPIAACMASSSWKWALGR